MSSEEEREIIRARARALDSEVASIGRAALEIKSDGIDRGSVSFSLWSIFNPKTYQKLEKYLSDCRNNLLPLSWYPNDIVPTFPNLYDKRFYDKHIENYADLNYFERETFLAAEHYVRYHQRNYQEYQNSQEKLDTKKQKGSSTKRISRKQRKVSKQQKRNSRT